MGEPDRPILVVDDDVDIARFVEVNLQLEGYEVMRRPRRCGRAAT